MKLHDRVLFDQQLRDQLESLQQRLEGDDSEAVRAVVEWWDSRANHLLEQLNDFERPVESRLWPAYLSALPPSDPNA